MWDRQYWEFNSYFQIDYWGDAAPGDAAAKDQRTNIHYRLLGPIGQNMLGGVRVFVERK